MRPSLCCYTLSHSLLCLSCTSNPGLPHCSVRLLCSSLLLAALRPSHTHAHTRTHKHNRTHTSWSSRRTRGGGKRVEVFGPASRHTNGCLQTAGNVELMSVCFNSSPFLSVGLSVCLSAWRSQVNTCSSCCRLSFSEAQKEKGNGLSLGPSGTCSG